MKMNKTHLNTASLNVCRLNMVGEFSKKSPLLSVCSSGADVVELENAKGNATSLTLKGYTTKESKAVVCNNGKIVGVDKDLPKGYARLTGIIMNDDTYYEIDGFRLKGSDTLKVSFTALKACNILGCYTTADAEDNYSIFASTTSGAKYLRYNGGTYLSAITANKRYDITVTPTGATGFDKASTWKEADFTSSTDMLIGSTSVNATSAKMTGTIHGDIEVVGRALFVPCKRLSDGTIGYYETYNKVFYEPSVGVPVAEGYDISRIDVIYGDNPENVEVRGIYDSRLPNGYTPIEYAEGNGSSDYIDTGIVINNLNAVVECDFQMTGNTTSTPEMIWGYMDGASNIPRWGFGEYTTKWLGSPNNTTSVGTSDLARHKSVLRVFTEGTTTYYDGSLDGESIYNKSSLASAQAFESNVLSIYLFARNNKRVAGNFGTCRIYSFKVYVDGELAHDLVPCKNKDGIVGFYDAKGKTFVTSVDGALVGGDAVNGVVSSASVANLYAVDRFVDEQEIVKGAVTRRLGVLVLDGTEKWIKATNTSADGHAVFYVTVNERANNDTSLKLLSSHYSFRGTVSYSTLKTGEMSITQTTRNIYFDGGNASSTAEWASYLEEQYASGNPVVVVYPLAEEKTESAKGQSIKLAEGNNTITRVSGVSGLEMTCCYKQKPKEEDSGGLIAFTMQGVSSELQAEKGMTWHDWCNSEFNPFTWGNVLLNKSIYDVYTWYDKDTGEDSVVSVDVYGSWPIGSLEPEMTDAYTLAYNGVELRASATIIDGAIYDRHADLNELITFSIDGTAYQAESGMTMGQWVESHYNTGGFVFVYDVSWTVSEGITNDGGVTYIHVDEGWNTYVVESYRYISEGDSYYLSELNSGGGWG